MIITSSLLHRKSSDANIAFDSPPRGLSERSEFLRGHPFFWFVFFAALIKKMNAGVEARLDGQCYFLMPELILFKGREDFSLRSK